MDQGCMLHVENGMESTCSPTKLLIINCLEGNDNGKTLKCISDRDRHQVMSTHL